MGQEPAAHPLPALAESSWRLVAIQSMDDAQGASAPPSGQTYRVTFGADGRAAFTLNCNRAVAGWSAELTADGRSGSLAFTAIAMTRAFCPPPSLDTRIARDMGFVRSYLQDDTTLSMSLSADGGIYQWTRDEAP
nr:META domain-containing protein [uncultured Rhodopila sp.]